MCPQPPRRMNCLQRRFDCLATHPLITCTQTFTGSAKIKARNTLLAKMSQSNNCEPQAVWHFNSGNQRAGTLAEYEKMLAEQTMQLDDPCLDVCLFALDLSQQAEQSSGTQDLWLQNASAVRKRKRGKSSGRQLLFDSFLADNSD
jgi:hypothetical protein